MSTYAMMGFQPTHEDVSPFARIVWRVYNRSGNPTVAGALYQFDTRLTTTAESTANSRGEILPAVTDYTRGRSGAFGNIVHIEFASSLSGDLAPQAALKYCLALEAVADNEPLKALVVGTYASYTAYFANSAATVSTTWPAAHRLYAGPSTTNGGAFAFGVGTESPTYSYMQQYKPPIAIGFPSLSIVVASSSASTSTSGGMFFDGWNYIPSRL